MREEYSCCSNKCMTYIPGDGYTEEQKRKDIAYLNERCLTKIAKPINFDCKVCEKCGKAMTAKEYHEHTCKEVGLVEKHDYDEEIEEDPWCDPWCGGNEHQGDFF